MLAMEARTDLEDRAATVTPVTPAAVSMAVLARSFEPDILRILNDVVTTGLRTTPNG